MTITHEKIPVIFNVKSFFEEEGYLMSLLEFIHNIECNHFKLKIENYENHYEVSQILDKNEIKDTLLHVANHYFHNVPD